MVAHVLLEVYCSFDEEHNGSKNLRCDASTHTPSYSCLYNKCPYAVFTSCENAMCYTGENATANEVVSFGGEMAVLPANISEADAIKLWEQIAEAKINEAYAEYMKRIKEGLNDGIK